MTWVKTRLEGEAQAAAQAAVREAMTGYPPGYGGRKSDRVPELVKNDSIINAHLLIPDALKHFFSGLKALFSPNLPLSRRQQEMIAVHVSRLNDCFY